jgi:hypothetical protein
VIFEFELDQTERRRTEDDAGSDKAIGAVRTVPSSRRETRPNANTTVATTTRSITAGFRDVGDTQTE